MAGIKQFAAKGVQAKQIEHFCAFRRKLGKTAKISPVSLDRAATDFSRDAIEATNPAVSLHEGEEHEQAIPYRLRRQGVTKDGKKKSYWRSVGAIWPHKNGEGFDVEPRRVSRRLFCLSQAAMA